MHNGLHTCWWILSVVGYLRSRVLCRLAIPLASGCLFWIPSAFCNSACAAAACASPSLWINFCTAARTSFCWPGGIPNFCLFKSPLSISFKASIDVKPSWRIFSTTSLLILFSIAHLATNSSSKMVRTSKSWSTAKSAAGSFNCLPLTNYIATFIVPALTTTVSYNSEAWQLVSCMLFFPRARPIVSSWTCSPFNNEKQILSCNSWEKRFYTELHQSHVNKNTFCPRQSIHNNIVFPIHFKLKELLRRKKLLCTIQNCCYQFKRHLLTDLSAKRCGLLIGCTKRGTSVMHDGSWPNYWLSGKHHMTRSLTRSSMGDTAGIRRGTWKSTLWYSSYRKF